MDQFIEFFCGEAEPHRLTWKRSVPSYRNTTDKSVDCEQGGQPEQRLAETPEPGGPGSLLDHTTIVWTNELGQGNSHTLDNIPFVLVGNGLNFKMGQSLKYKNVPHNRLLMTLAHGMGHRLTKFGNPDYCGDGILTELML